MVRQTRNIPQAKEGLVSDAEKQEAFDYHNNTDATYFAGINVGKPGAYDPEAGHAKHAVEPSESEPKPLLVTDPGQPKGITAKVTGQRDTVSGDAIDKSKVGVVQSKVTGRKSTAPRE